MKPVTIYTVGHSTPTIEVFLSMLESFDIKTIVDIRRFPGSRKFPQFNQDNLKIALEEDGIQYISMLELGGRRKPNNDSKNTIWKNESFRGYADYMETAAFENAVLKLEEIATKYTTAYMCSEALWYRCHRAMVSDYLKAKGWNVLHIMNIAKVQQHKYTEPARIVDGKIYYSDEK